MKLVSSNIKEVDFIPDEESSGTLSITFHSGTTYHYSGVKHKVFRELVKAESAGKYFDKEIKRNYKYQKVSE